MTDMDEWGLDPSVRSMRKVFKDVETAQRNFLERLDISPYDLRVRRWRERTLGMFERAWGIATRTGSINMDEGTAAIIYIHCLSLIMDSDGIDVPEELLPDVKGMEVFFKEVFL